MADFKFNKEKVVGYLSKTDSTTFELSLVSWSGATAKYDLRKWGDGGNKPFKGVTFNEKELRTLMTILEKALVSEKSNVESHKYEFGTISASIFNVFGEYKSTGKMKGKVTYTSWGTPAKYDIRPWSDDYSTCGKGVSLSEGQCKILIDLIKKELNINQMKIEYDTSNIDDDLFL